MSDSDKELDEILTEMVENTVMFLKNDLPSLLQQEEDFKVRRHHKDDILKNLPEAKQRLNALIEKKVREAVNEATQPYHYTMPIKSVRTRNTAFKLYAVKFFNGNIKKRRERLLAQLQDNQAKEGL